MSREGKLFSLSRVQLILWVFGSLRWPVEQLLDLDTAAAGREALMQLCLRQSLPRCALANRLTRSPCRDGTVLLKTKRCSQKQEPVNLQYLNGGHCFSRSLLQIKLLRTSTIRAVGSLPWGIRISTWIHGVHLIVVLSPWEKKTDVRHSVAWKPQTFDGKCVEKHVTSFVLVVRRDVVSPYLPSVSVPYVIPLSFPLSLALPVALSVSFSVPLSVWLLVVRLVSFISPLG